MTTTLVGSATPPRQSQATQLRLYAVSDPAAGTDWTVTVPSSEFWQLLAVKYSFTTSAAVATRSANMHPVLLGQGFGDIPAPATLGASAVANYLFAAGVPSIGGINYTYAGLPDFPWPPGSQLGSRVSNLQAGDQLTNIVLYVLAYL